VGKNVTSGGVLRAFWGKGAFWGLLRGKGPKRAFRILKKGPNRAKML